MEMQSLSKVDCVTLKQRYVDACRRHGILPNKGICSSLFMVEVNNSQCKKRILEVFLDHLKDSDFLPLFELLSEIDNSVIDGVDIYNKTPCVMSGSYILLLMRVLNNKLCAVHLNDLSLERVFLRDLSQRGLTCKVLNLRSSRLRKLNLSGSFVQLQTLNLDFNTSLTSFQESCFSCMPNLKHLSLCATRVCNLWTTVAALSKLPSLAELRFQNCLCCNNTGPCPESAAKKIQDDGWGVYHENFHVGTSSMQSLQLDQPHLRSNEMLRDTSFIEDESMDAAVQLPSDEFSEDNEGDVPNYYHEFGSTELLLDAFHNWELLNNNVVPLGIIANEAGGFSAVDFHNRNATSLADTDKKYLSHHPSPICFEKHYRDYMIASLSQLQVLDNLPVSNKDKESAKSIFSKCFEYLPYKRRHKENILRILNNREVFSRNSCLHTSAYYHSRSLGAAKVGSSSWPYVHPLSTSGYVFGDEIRNFRPRQFEYHPSDSGLMAFGTLDGEVVVVNHENENIFSYVPSLGTLSSVLGLCWLKKYPFKLLQCTFLDSEHSLHDDSAYCIYADNRPHLIAGSDNGSLRLYDIKCWQSAVRGRNFNPSDFAFDNFDQLTSVHVNATDELFIASGYSKDVALYDIGTGKRASVFTDMHKQHINVVKFSNHSPSIFATSSFDQDVKMWDLRQRPLLPCFKSSSSRGNVMVCFSPDDLYLLVSAVDNEVKQLSAVDGRILLDFDIASTGSSQNYTRSYYMNGRDYIISGSCDENVVRVCCAQTGRRLRDISLKGRQSGASMFVQSLRGDPFRDFNMSILAAYLRPSSKSEIIKVNLLAASDYSSDPSDDETYLPSFSMGG